MNTTTSRIVSLFVILGLAAAGVWLGLVGRPYEEYLFVAGQVDQGVRWCKAFWVVAIICACTDIAFATRETSGFASAVKLTAFLAVVGWAMVDIGSVRDPHGFL